MNIQIHTQACMPKRKRTHTYTYAPPPPPPHTHTYIHPRPHASPPLSLPSSSSFPPSPTQHTCALKHAPKHIRAHRLVCAVITSYHPLLSETTNNQLNVVYLSRNVSKVERFLSCLVYAADVVDAVVDDDDVGFFFLFSLFKHLFYLLFFFLALLLGSCFMLHSMRLRTIHLSSSFFELTLRVPVCSLSFFLFLSRRLLSSTSQHFPSSSRCTPRLSSSSPLCLLLLSSSPSPVFGLIVVFLDGRV